MIFNLIPFGFHAKNQKLLDIAEVPRGLSCGCICPSCKTPLIARHGNVKEWHFAHASRDVFDKTEKKCEYSFFVSVRMMARQIIGEELSITLPSYESCVSEFIPDYGDFEIPFIITNQQEITLKDIKLEQTVIGAVVDVYGNVDGFDFIIYFSHPHREVPEALIESSDKKIGVISISLLMLEILFLKAKESKKPYQQILYDFLVSDIQSKQWVFHPRFEKCKASALEVLSKEVDKKKKELFESNRVEREEQAQFAKNSSVRKKQIELIIEVSKRRVIYKCVFTGVEWEGLEPGGSKCPSCNNILCRTIKKHLD